MYETAPSEELESAYAVRFRSREVLDHPREFSSQERHERDSRYGRRSAAPSLKDGVARRCNKRFAG